MSTFISLGAQCTSPMLFDKLGVKAKSLPFDWMFSTPEFVYTILKLMLVDKKEIDDIVKNDFFICDKIARWSKEEPAHYINTSNGDGDVLINSKYNVAFPHNTISDTEIYIRRLERLKELIFDEIIFINFVYISIPRNNYFIVNGIEPIKNLYDYIEKINSILKSIRTNYKILIFDTNKPLEIMPSDTEHMLYYDIEKQHCFTHLIPVLIDKINDLIENKVINK